MTQKGSLKPRSHASASTYRKGHVCSCKDGKSWEAHSLPGPDKDKAETTSWDVPLAWKKQDFPQETETMSL